jgi:hypothetical protein
MAAYEKISFSTLKAKTNGMLNAEYAEKFKFYVEMVMIIHVPTNQAYV